MKSGFDGDVRRRRAQTRRRASVYLVDVHAVHVDRGRVLLLFELHRHNERLEVGARRHALDPRAHHEEREREALDLIRASSTPGNCP